MLSHGDVTTLYVTCAEPGGRGVALLNCERSSVRTHRFENTDPRTGSLRWDLTALGCTQTGLTLPPISETRLPRAHPLNPEVTDRTLRLTAAQRLRVPPV
ncbi:unnamed protein product [Pleuronectes platessa]|uniref:Uncharacterized protein n=1 Tax=Pleuronectes platessa TaxID=8262 RepID=A0A9N7W0K5_PLEPL|nr:unnamed protein product [Pleuronectes platessa]